MNKVLSLLVVSLLLAGNSYAGLLDPPTLTHEQQVVQEIAELKNIGSSLNRTILIYHTQMFDSIWTNSIASPQEVMDAFGVNAISLFVLSSQLQTTLLSIDDTYVPLVPPFEFVINADGTVTIGNPTP